MTADQLTLLPIEAERYRYVGGHITFTCQSENNERISATWLINNRPYTDYFEYADIDVNQLSQSASVIYIGDIGPELNQTTIKCMAIINDEQCYSNNSTLLLQGISLI